MIQPPKLKVKDKAVIISPAGFIEKELITATAQILQNWGLDVDISSNALHKMGRFSGTVEERLSDLQNAIDDANTKLIFCSRGGYGIVHLLDKLDFTGLKNNPKWIIGYSDITALHSALQVNGIMSLHAPMAKHFYEEGSSDTSVIHTRSILEGYDLEYTIKAEEDSHLNKKGIAKGNLFGGNLAVMCGLLGTKYSYIPQGGILFIEDIGEEPYKIDRFIHQLKLAGVFSKISGLVVGQFSDYKEDPLMYSSLYQSISNVLGEYTFPICFNFPVGHVKENMPMIVGKDATLIVKDNHITFKQKI